MSAADEIAKLAELKAQGALSADEFEAEKAKVLRRGDASGNAAVAPQKPVEKTGMGLTLKLLLWIGGAVTAFLIFGASVGNSPEGKARAADRDAIALCWKEQERKSLDPGTQRFVARTCEMMEEKFRNAWGRNP